MNNVHLALLAILVGCEDSGGDRCSDPATVTGTVVANPMRQPLTADLVVRGTVDAPANATVYEVQVNGIAATSRSVDFRTWDVTIPLVALAAASQDGMTALTAVAFTNCSTDPIVLGKTSVMVEPVPGILVTQLKLTPAIPASASYLPSSVPASAIITVDGNPLAAGATAAVTASSGTLSADHVVLGGDGMTDAIGQLLFSSTTPGTAIITATAMGSSGYTSVTVIGPPRFAPGGVNLAPGSSLRVTVLTTGQIQSCQATPARGLHVMSGIDLMSGTGGIDQTGDGLIDVDVSVDANLPAAVVTTLSCRDVFGQVGTAMFTSSPGD